MPISTYPNIIYPDARTTGGDRSVGGFPNARNASDPSNTKYIAPIRRDIPSNENTSSSNIGGDDLGGPAEVTELARGGPLYTIPSWLSNGWVIEPWMHRTYISEQDATYWHLERYRGYQNASQIDNRYTTNRYDIFKAIYNHNFRYAYTTKAHTTTNEGIDPNNPWADYLNDYPLEYVPGTDTSAGHFNLPYRKNQLYQFRGGMTPVNPEKDPDKQYILDTSLELSEKKRNNTSTNQYGEDAASSGVPTSPLHPFMRTYADRAHQAIVSAYNRTKIPIADIEHRKGFRYIFITRPECYLLADSTTPCLQMEQDEDMHTAWCRMPHVIRALSPVYVAPAYGRPSHANWNYLLCNRVMNMDASGQTLAVNDSVTKGVRGATVTPGKNITSNLGGTLSISFRDTKYMDVYETLRLWTWYIHKRTSGAFFPPFNCYQRINDFPGSGRISTHGGSKYHPYDRALEYCASIYDIITNETGTKILYWCKYYGVYPTSVTSSILSASKNGSSLTDEATVSSSFQYQYKRENVFKNLVEFNYNAGIFDNMGVLRADVSDYIRNEASFLYLENGLDGTSGQPTHGLSNYIGAAGMFTGSPFIVSETAFSEDPWRGKQQQVVRSYLQFMPVSSVDQKLEDQMNLGISVSTRTTITTSALGG